MSEAAVVWAARHTASFPADDHALDLAGADVFIFTGGLDDAAPVFSVHASNGAPSLTDDPSTETQETSAASPS
jgi:hypothetical protein